MDFVVSSYNEILHIWCLILLKESNIIPINGKLLVSLIKRSSIKKCFSSRVNISTTQMLYSNKLIPHLHKINSIKNIPNVEMISTGCHNKCNNDPYFCTCTTSYYKIHISDTILTIWWSKYNTNIERSYCFIW